MTSEDRKEAAHTVTIAVNGQQKAFIERLQSAAFEGAAVPELVLRALAELGPELLGGERPK